MSNTALITGATSGIGNAFARQLAQEGMDLVIVARDVIKLAETAEALTKFGVNVETIAADLSTDHGLSMVEARLKSDEAPISLLINNAGFGLKGVFATSNIDDHERMMRLNMVAVVRLTHAALPGMIKLGHSGIINVSSVAGFTPGLRPSSTYAATKAFVTAFTEGLAHTVAKEGVRMTALCPGFVKSNFHTSAGINMSRLPKLLWLEPDVVVKAGLEDHRKGKAVSVPGWQYKFIVGATRLTPQSLQNIAARYVSRRAG